MVDEANTAEIAWNQSGDYNATATNDVFALNGLVNLTIIDVLGKQ